MRRGEIRWYTCRAWRLLTGTDRRLLERAASPDSVFNTIRAGTFARDN